MTFIVKFWARIFGWLAYISVFRIIMEVRNRRRGSSGRDAPTVRFVDAWVLAHLVLAVVTCVTFPALIKAYQPLAMGLTIYGAARIFEVINYQINALLFDEFRLNSAGKTLEIEDNRRRVVLLLHNFAEIIFWFAAVYIVFADHFEVKNSVGGGGVLMALYNSFVTTTTFGEYNISPSTNFGIAIILAQSSIGLLMTLISLAHFLSALPIPKAKSARTDS